MARFSRAAVLILAAGQGKRMRSAVPKVFHALYDKPVLSYVVETALETGRTFVVINDKQKKFGVSLPSSVTYIIQSKQLGTGHAALVGKKYLEKFSDILILSGDTPLIKQKTIRKLLSEHIRNRACATVLSTKLSAPYGYGRIVRDAKGNFSRIAEESDASESERAICEINTGTYCFSRKHLFKYLPKLTRKNRQREYYLTDALGLMTKAGERIRLQYAEDWTEVLGINTRAELAIAHEVLRQRKINALLESGVTIVDPRSAFIAPDVIVGKDTVIAPFVAIEGATSIGERCKIGFGAVVKNCKIGENVVIHPHSVLEESQIENGASVGPFARLRTGTYLSEGAKVGNFVETKKVCIGKNSKAMHLTYLGDAQIGKNVNVGAGTITCNYDGYEKHMTILEDGVFVGSDTQFVAPVKVGEGAYIGAGSTITKDVPKGALAVSRAKQENKEGWAKKYKKIKKAKKAR